MKRNLCLSLIAMLLLVLAFGLGYWSGRSQARNGVRVIVARDTGDSQQSSGKVGYEPYFTKQNPIPDKVK